MPDDLSQEPRAGGQSGVRSADRLERPEIVVRPNLNRSPEHEVSSATFGELTRADTRGGFSSPLPQPVTKSSILSVEYAMLTLQVRGRSVIDLPLDARPAQRAAWRTAQREASRAPAHSSPKGCIHELASCAHSRTSAITPNSTRCWAALHHRAHSATLR